MSLSPQKAILVLAFIILIYLVVLYGRDFPIATTVLAGGAMMVIGYYLLSDASEHLTENVGGAVTTDLTDGDTPLADEDQYIGSYQNIRTGDVDNMLQRPYNLDFAKIPGTPFKSESDEIDNSDVIEEAISRGNAVFQPSMQGVSATSGAELSNFNMAEPGPITTYTIPLNNRATSVDESLSRKQQHRSGINKKAIDGMVRSTKNVFQKYFQNELNENEGRVWWSAEAEEVETDFRPPY